MAANGFYLIVTVLAFSHLLFMANAISPSGKVHRHLLHEKVEFFESGDNNDQVNFINIWKFMQINWSYQIKKES
ncbi:hypothetical protein R6Q57_015135 [Mikania cordata]